MRALLILLVTAGAARADGLVVGAQAGGFVPFAKLDPTVTIGVEAGWGRGPLALVVAVDLAQPTADGAAGEADYALRVRELRLSAQLSARARLGPVVGFIAAGPALLHVDTHQSGRTAGRRFAADERETTVCGVGAVGIERPLGRGAIVGSVLVGVASFDGVLLGSASAGSVEVRVGYRVWL